jgi:hypothetical protein
LPLWQWGVFFFGRVGCRRTRRALPRAERCSAGGACATVRAHLQSQRKRIRSSRSSFSGAVTSFRVAPLCHRPRRPTRSCRRDADGLHHSPPPRLRGFGGGARWRHDAPDVARCPRSSLQRLGPGCVPRRAPPPAPAFPKDGGPRGRPLGDSEWLSCGVFFDAQMSCRVQSRPSGPWRAPARRTTRAPGRAADASASRAFSELRVLGGSPSVVSMCPLTNSGTLDASSAGVSPFCCDWGKFVSRAFLKSL